MNDHKTDKNLIDFLKTHKLLVLATADKEGNPWVTNVYYSADKDLNLFFISSPETKHGRDLKQNKNVSFSIPWYDEKNLGNRKAIQGTGKCELIKDAATIIRFLKNHYIFYPLWKSIITHENMLNNVIDSKPYIIKPNYMKFWNDELYGDEGTKEFNFN